VPEPGEGRVRTADRLGTAAEVEVLASVLLARDTPLPLAVGLFGDWGSGKSFFMAHLYERMAELAGLAADGRPEAEPYCRVVRQIRFNAWHYVDTNLWASLATTLFDELARADVPEQAKVKLDELDRARADRDEAHRRREDLEREERKLQADAERPRLAAQGAWWAVLSAVRGNRQLRSHLKKAAQAAEEPSDEGTDADLERLIGLVGGVEGAAAKARTVWRLFQEEVLHRRPLVTLVTMAVLVGAAVAGSVVAGWSVATRVAALLGAVVVALTPALQGALRLLYLAREARQARERPLVQKRDEVLRAQAQEREAEQAVADRERELVRLRDAGLQLREFVRQRATSSDYRDQLGTISRVRRDFEQLVALLPGSAERAGPEQVAAAAAAVTQRLPNAERIVLYIDDLDRCPHDKVVEVLQAVHLLLAFRLFVVVVGVDSRWLERSLRAHYHDLLDEPASYLEKIFQIPFLLRPMTPPRYRTLIDELAPLRAPDPARAARSTPASPDGGGEPAENQLPMGSRPTTEPAAAHRSESVGTAASEPPVLPRPEALVLSEAERRLLRELGDLIPTPRAAKRLVNIYRMLRVSVPPDELDAFHDPDGGEYQAVALLLAILVGRPATVESVFRAVMAAPGDADIWQVLAGHPSLLEDLTPVRQHMTLGRAAPYRRWAPRVARYSLRFISVPPAHETSEPTPGDR